MISGLCQASSQSGRNAVGGGARCRHSSGTGRDEQKEILPLPFLGRPRSPSFISSLRRPRRDYGAISTFLSANF